MLVGGHRGHWSLVTNAFLGAMIPIVIVIAVSVAIAIAIAVVAAAVANAIAVAIGIGIGIFIVIGIGMGIGITVAIAIPIAVATTSLTAVVTAIATAIAIPIAAKPRIAFALHTSRQTLVMWVVARRNEAQVAGGRRLALDDMTGGNATSEVQGGRVCISSAVI